MFLSTFKDEEHLTDKADNTQWFPTWFCSYTVTELSSVWFYNFMCKNIEVIHTDIWEKHRATVLHGGGLWKTSTSSAIIQEAKTYSHYMKKSPWLTTKIVKPGYLISFAIYLCRKSQMRTDLKSTAFCISFHVLWRQEANRAISLFFMNNTCYQVSSIRFMNCSWAKSHWH